MTKNPRVPRALAGRIEPTLTIEQVLKRIAYERALRPPRVPVTSDEFEQIVYDAIARNKAMSRAEVVRWAKKVYAVTDGREAA